MSTTRVALVSVRAFGLGAEIARSLGEAGVSVAVGVKAQRPDDEHRRPPGVVSLHQGRITVPADCERVVKEVVEQHGRLDILVCATVPRGLTADRPVELTDAGTWDDALASGLSGPFYLVRAALPQMLAQGHGRIVTVLPLDGGRGSVGQAPAGVAAAGIVALTRRLAREVAGRGVTVNAVVAGLTEGAIPMAEMDEEMAAHVTSALPVGRLAQPAEVARVVEFLCSPDAGYVTGQVVAADGGVLA